MRIAFWAAFLVVVPVLTARAESPPRVWMNDHFFVAQTENFEPPDSGVRAQGLLGLEAHLPDVCRGHIRRVLVLSDADGLISASTAGGEAMPYIAFLEGVYDVLPKALQRMFCSVSRLEVGIRPGGFLIAGVTDEGVELSLHRGLLDALTSASDYYSWLEQIPLGGAQGPTITWHQNLPHLRFQTDRSQILALTVFAMSHAFGHLLDWAGGLSLPNTRFTQLTWHDPLRPLVTSDFSGRSELVWSAGFSPRRILEAHETEDLYDGWFKSGFVSMRASENPSEDFAETLALDSFARLPKAQLWLYTGDGPGFDLVKRSAPKSTRPRWGEKILQEKQAYLRRLLEGPDLIYP